MVVMEYEISETNTEPFPTSNSVNSFYAGKSSFFTRIYAPIGISATLFNRVQFGLEGTLGLGMQNVYNGRTYLMPFSSSITTKLSFVF